MTARGRGSAAPAAGGDLPDLNVWVAMAVTEHPHHQVARAYWHDTAAPKVWFCRVTMLGFVRLLTQPKLMGKASMSLRDAFSAYRRFASLPEVGLQAEPAGCEAALHRLLRHDTPGRLWTDAYLAAFAATGGLRLVSFDRDFARFAELTWLQLQPE